MEKYTTFMDWKNPYSENEYTTQSIFGFNAIHIKLPTIFFTELEQITSLFVWKHTHKKTILKEISPGWSLEGLMLKLKLQYFGHLMQRVDSLEKTLMLGGNGGRRRRG